MVAFRCSLPVLKIYNLCQVYHKFSLLAVNIGTQSMNVNLKVSTYKLLYFLVVKEVPHSNRIVSKVIITLFKDP